MDEPRSSTRHRTNVQGSSSVRNTIFLDIFHALSACFWNVPNFHNVASTESMPRRKRASTCVDCLKQESLLLCEECGSALCAECCVECAKCETRLCRACRIYCPICQDVSTCPSCRVRCGECAVLMCDACLKERCEGCGEALCAKCAEMHSTNRVYV